MKYYIYKFVGTGIYVYQGGGIFSTTKSLAKTYSTRRIAAAIAEILLSKNIYNLGTKIYIAEFIR